ncbi:MULTISPECIES: DUF2399 domain-containing protein [unclassified Acinetobacter]|jgi:hypothetical protein|uniref:DUF7281 domain-containing protein n=1 Tax=unclassified Acinetobacter TaxID=196816 RepID=UPI0015D2744C|nr:MULTISPECIES: DUF2399 domain-containing protein [unclassified Acinetobacter]
MTFGLRELSIIQTALQLKKRSITFNKTWQKVHQDYQIGAVHGKELHLTSKELEYLEYCIYAKQVKVAPEQSLNLESDRMDLLNFLKDEKSGGYSVFGDQLVFASVHAKLPLKQGDVVIGYKGLVPTVHANELIFNKIEKLIIVENGTMLTRLFDWYEQLPEAWQDSLFLYRGQGQNARQVFELLAKLPDHTEISFYGDFDPFGLNIAAHFLKHRTMSILIPECWQEISRNHVDNNTAKFFEQIHSSHDLYADTAQPVAIRNLYRHVHINQIALMQENVNRLGPLIELKMD